MQAIEFKSPKGGVGKTTFCISAAGYLRKQYPDARIAILNKDIQGSINGFFMRARDRDCQIFDVITQRKHAFDYDYVLIDHRPDLDSKVLTDFVVCPVLPETLSMDSTQAFIDDLDRKRIYVGQILNRVELTRSHEKYRQYPQFANGKVVAKRQAYPDMTDEGKSIFQKPENRVFGLNYAQEEFSKAFKQCLDEYQFFKMTSEERKAYKQENNLPDAYMEYVINE